MCRLFVLIICWWCFCYLVLIWVICFLVGFFRVVILIFQLLLRRMLVLWLVMLVVMVIELGVLVWVMILVFFLWYLVLSILCLMFVFCNSLEMYLEFLIDVVLIRIGWLRVWYCLMLVMIVVYFFFWVRQIRLLKFLCVIGWWVGIIIMLRLQIWWNLKVLVLVVLVMLVSLLYRWKQFWKVVEVRVWFLVWIGKFFFVSMVWCRFLDR